MFGGLFLLDGGGRLCLRSSLQTGARAVRSGRLGWRTYPTFYTPHAGKECVIRYVLVVEGRSAESLDERIYRAWPKGYLCARRAIHVTGARARARASLQGVSY